MGFTGRYPFTRDAYSLGYTVGFRVDTSGFQTDDVPNVELPVDFLDNAFHAPDRERYLEAVDRYRPDVAVVGDAYDQATAESLQSLADEIAASYSAVEPVIVPKCRDALDVLNQATVVGYSNGYADQTADEFSDLHEWRDRNVHVLGGSPTSQYHVVQQLTQPTLDEQPPANIVGVDTNCFHKVAYKGEYWTPDGWQSADHLSIRETVRTSLEYAKWFWKDHGMWPAATPIEQYGPAVRTPDDSVYAEHGGTIRTQPDLETAYIGVYDDGTYAFESRAGKRFVEYRDGLLPQES